MKFSRGLLLAFISTNTDAFIVPYAKHGAPIPTRNSDEGCANSELRDAAFTDVATAIADGTAATAFANTMGSAEFPLVAAPVAALAAGSQALKSRDEINDDLVLTERALQDTRQQLQNSERIVTAAFGTAAVSLALAVSNVMVLAEPSGGFAPMAPTEISRVIPSASVPSSLVQETQTSVEDSNTEQLQADDNDKEYTSMMELDAPKVPNVESYSTDGSTWSNNAFDSDEMQTQATSAEPPSTHNVPDTVAAELITAQLQTTEGSETVMVVDDELLPKWQGEYNIQADGESMGSSPDIDEFGFPPADVSPDNDKAPSAAFVAEFSPKEEVAATPVAFIGDLRTEEDSQTSEVLWHDDTHISSHDVSTNDVVAFDPDSPMAVSASDAFVTEPGESGFPTTAFSDPEGVVVDQLAAKQAGFVHSEEATGAFSSQLEEATPGHVDFGNEFVADESAEYSFEGELEVEDDKILNSYQFEEDQDASNSYVDFGHAAPAEGFENHYDQAPRDDFEHEFVAYGSRDYDIDESEAKDQMDQGSPSISYEHGFEQVEEAVAQGFTSEFGALSPEEIASEHDVSVPVGSASNYDAQPLDARADAYEESAQSQDSAKFNMIESLNTDESFLQEAYMDGNVKELVDDESYDSPTYLAGGEGTLEGSELYAADIPPAFEGWEDATKATHPSEVMVNEVLEHVQDSSETYRDGFGTDDSVPPLSEFTASEVWEEDRGLHYDSEYANGFEEMEHDTQSPEVMVNAFGTSGEASFASEAYESMQAHEPEVPSLVHGNELASSTISDHYESPGSFSPQSSMDLEHESFENVNDFASPDFDEPYASEIGVEETGPLADARDVGSEHGTFSAGWFEPEQDLNDFASINAPQHASPDFGGSALELVEPTESIRGPTDAMHDGILGGSDEFRQASRTLAVDFDQ